MIYAIVAGKFCFWIVVGLAMLGGKADILLAVHGYSFLFGCIWQKCPGNRHMV